MSRWRPEKNNRYHNLGGNPTSQPWNTYITRQHTTLNVPVDQHTNQPEPTLPAKTHEARRNPNHRTTVTMSESNTTHRSYTRHHNAICTTNETEPSLAQSGTGGSSPNQYKAPNPTHIGGCYDRPAHMVLRLHTHHWRPSIDSPTTVQRGNPTTAAPK